MSRRAWVTLLLVALVLVSAVDLARTPDPMAAGSGRPDASITGLAHRDSAVIPLDRLTRTVRGAVGPVFSVTLAALLALVALVALWSISSVRRRRQLFAATVTCFRRGPPALPHVS
jgi:hypothetical protein